MKFDEDINTITLSPTQFSSYKRIILSSGCDINEVFETNEQGEKTNVVQEYKVSTLANKPIKMLWDALQSDVKELIPTEE